MGSEDKEIVTLVVLQATTSPNSISAEQEPIKMGIADNKYAVHVLALGFLTFGTVLGGITGLSSWSGISNTLLTSLFAFVGGSLLSFAGFVSKKGGVAYVSGYRLGFCILAFSLGISSGLFIGIVIRREFELPDRDNAGMPKSSSLLHSESRNLCAVVRDKLATDAYGKDSSVMELRHDLEWFVRIACPAPRGPL